MTTDISKPSKTAAQKWGVVGFAVLLAAVAAVVVMAVRTATRDTGPSLAGGASHRPVGTTLDAILNTASDMIKTGDVKKAEAVLTAAISEHPDETRLYVLYAELLAGEKRLDEAYDQYGKALASGPREAEVEFAAGTVASMLGKYDRAVEHYSAAQAASPNDWKAPLFLAQVQLKLDQVDEAKKNLLLAARLRPEAAVAWGTLAEVALRENKTGIALQHVAKARELEPRVTMWRLIEARALKREGKVEEALKLLTALEDLQRREPGVMPLMAECYGMLSRPADAAAMYVAASDSDASRGEWAYEAALWLERAGKREEALAYATRAEMLAYSGAAEVAARLQK